MKKNILVIVIIIIIIIAGIVYYVVQPKTVGNVPASGVVASGTPAANATATAQVQSVLAKLATHMVLPTGETPQIGQIDDPVQATKAQPFVAGAIKGDLLIVYVKARKAIVYSPSRDLIVNVGPVSMNPTPTATSTPVKK